MKNIDLTSDKVNILGIAGSTGHKSVTRSVLDIVMHGAAENGACIEVIDLHELNLPIMGSTSEDLYPENVFTLRSAIKNADGIVFATPEYYGSLSGALKNAIDLSVYGDFEDKAVGLVGIAGGESGAVNSLNTMRTIARNLHAITLPLEVSIASSGKVVDENGLISDERIYSRLVELGHSISQFSAMMKLYRMGKLSYNINSILEHDRVSVSERNIILKKAV